MQASNFKDRTELDDFLAVQSEVGERQSSGEFAIAKEKALSKLGEFQLPFPEAWLLKIAQASVVLKSSSLDIQQTTKNTVLSLDAPPEWELELLEVAFFEPRYLGKLGLGQLMEGLWAASLNGGRPFQLCCRE